MNKKIVLLIVIILLGCGGFFVYQNLGGWIRTESQRIASDAAGVDVKIGGIDVNFSDKTIVVNNIKVANPKGFEAANSITLGNIRVQAEDLSREKIVLKEVVATGEFINLEMDGNKINLQELLNGIKSRNASGSKKSSSDIKAPKVIIKELRIEKGELSSSIGLLGKKTQNKMAIPTIRMNNLGEGKSSSNANEVAAKILQEILTKAIQTASSQGLLSSGGIKDAAKGLKGSAKGMMDSLLQKN